MGMLLGLQWYDGVSTGPAQYMVPPHSRALQHAGARVIVHAPWLLCMLQGRPVYIQLLGKIDISTLKQITTEERMIKFHIQEYERCGKVIMPICSRLAGRQIDQTFGIMDVKGKRDMQTRAQQLEVGTWELLPAVLAVVTQLQQ